MKTLALLSVLQIPASPPPTAVARRA